MIWSEKYRPNTIGDCILPKATMSKMKEFIELGKLPHLMLHGSQGTGKCLVGDTVIDVCIDTDTLTESQINLLSKYKTINQI